MRTEINFNKRLGILGRAAITFPGGSGPAPFESTKSLSFDGVDEYVEVADADNLSFGNGTTDSPFSISAWVNMTDATRFRIVSKYDSNLEYLFSTGGSDTIVFNCYDNSTVGKIGRLYSTALTSFQGTWIHLAATYSGNGSSTGLKIYLNGSRVDDTDNNSGSYTAMENTTTPLEIGKLTTTYANGLIDEVAIFNSELSVSDITAIYNNGKPADLTSLNSLVWYRAGENSTFASPQILMPENTNKDKVSNYSLDFKNGFCYFITSSVFDVLDGASQVTISFWLNSPLFASSGEDILWIPITTTSRSLQASLRSDGQMRFLFQNSSGSTSRVYSVIGDITANSWYHVMLTLDLTQPVGSKGKIFINGLDKTLAGSDTINITSITPAGDGIAIGANRLFGGFGAYYNGKLTQFAIWSNSNLQSQASAIYNSGTPTNISSLSPTVYYKFGEGTIFNTVWEETDSASSGFNLTGGPDFDRIEDRVGDAPNSENNALSINMEEADIVPDTP